MYIGGKNKDPDFLVGRAYVGYDCSAHKLCVAAYLDNQASFGTLNCTIVKSSGSTWVSYDNRINPAVKYKEADAIPSPPFGFKYVMFPDPSFPGGNRPIGK